jgi:hypothetical protein
MEDRHWWKDPGRRAAARYAWLAARAGTPAQLAEREQLAAGLDPARRDGKPCQAGCGWPLDQRVAEAGAGQYHPGCEPDGSWQLPPLAWPARMLGLPGGDRLRYPPGAAQRHAPEPAGAGPHPAEAPAAGRPGRNRRAPATRPGEKCPGGCGHAAHRDECPGKAPGRCAPRLDPATGEQNGHLHYETRAPCPCPHGWCHHCGAPVVGAATLPLYDGSPEIDIDRGSAGDGQLAVWKLADGTLAVRRLAPGQDPGPGQWRGREHHCELEDTTP